MNLAQLADAKLLGSNYIVHHLPTDKTVQLDGAFTLFELELIVSAFRETKELCTLVALQQLENANEPRSDLE